MAKVSFGNHAGSAGGLATGEPCMAMLWPIVLAKVQGK